MISFPIPGHLLPHLGGSVLGARLWIRRVDEVQEADQRAALGSQPDSESSVHPLVVSYDQQGQREWLS